VNLREERESEGLSLSNWMPAGGGRVRRDRGSPRGGSKRKTPDAGNKLSRKKKHREN